MYMIFMECWYQAPKVKKLLAVAGSLLLSFANASDNFDRGPDCLISARLGVQLSTNASIILPDSSSFPAFQTRSSAPRINPNYNAIVEVATEEDVKRTIAFANSCNISFLAISGSHGWPVSMNKAQDTIQISLRQLQQVRVIGDGRLARVGGGVLQRSLVQQLYAQGKQAVTGLAECVSISGPLLGGGHSVLQGLYGFAADNLVSARVVLADARGVTVSADENEDLFWALRGAGHNFGVVTSFEINAFDLPPSNWTVATLTYTQDSLEDFVDALNEVDNGGDHTAELILFGSIARNDEVDMTNPVISYQVAFLGTLEEAAPYVQRLQEACPVSTTIMEDIAYKDLSVAINNGANSTACIKEHNLVGYGVSLPVYNKTAIREAFGYYSEITSDSRFNESGWLLESYGSRGVQAMSYSATALPAAERDLPILTAPIFLWAGSDADAQSKAERYGQRIRTALAAGASQTLNQSHVYVNYAKGGESLEQMYGSSTYIGTINSSSTVADPHLQASAEA